MPLGSSSTECARRHMDIRHFGIAGRIFKTLRFLFRNKTSIGNFMPMVCTPSHGVIQRPSPGSNLVCLSKPVFRVALVFAMFARSASRVPRD